jgi:hypothetical protein
LTGAGDVLVAKRALTDVQNGVVEILFDPKDR